MKRSLLSLIIILNLCIACSSSRQMAAANVTEITDADRDGSSFEKAVIINETHEWNGIIAEHDWLAKHYPGYTILRRALKYRGKKTYDVNEILTLDGKSPVVYLDISNFFGNK